MLVCYITGLYPRHGYAGWTCTETSNYIKTLLSINLFLPPPNSDIRVGKIHTTGISKASKTRVFRLGGARLKEISYWVFNKTPHLLILPITKLLVPVFVFMDELVAPRYKRTVNLTIICKAQFKIPQMGE